MRCRRSSKNASLRGLSDVKTVRIAPFLHNPKPVHVNLRGGCTLAIAELGIPAGADPSGSVFVNRSRNITTMKRLLAATIVAAFATGVAYAADAPKDASKDKKPTAEDCKKAADAKKELAGCEKPKK